MKNITTVLILFFATAFVSSAQSYNHEQLSRALKLKDIPKKISEYTASNGQVFKVGETLTFGTPMNENNVFAHIYGLDALGTATSFGIRDKGWEVNNIDSVIIAERPKIMPYVELMKKNISDILNVDENVIGIKATTN